MAERRPYEFLAGGESSGEAIDVHGEDDVDLDVELEREDSRLRPEKKRRLRAEQVQSLERSFEVENKLEPERKLQLAMELGLQPRQVAIWFQNRRARWKTKQLEKDYQALQACYDALVAKYEALAAEKEKLRSEVVALTEKLRLKEKGEPPVAVAAAAELEDKLFVGKQEEVSAANSAVLDGDGDMAALELTSSFTALEQDADDLSPAPAVEDDAEEPPRLTSFGLAGDHAFWLWPTD